MLLKHRRVVNFVTLAVILVAGLLPVAQTNPVAGQTAYNYAEALQKSIYFYDAEKSGPGITGGRLEWRGNSDLSDMTVPLKPKGADGLGTNMSQAFIDANRAVLDPDGNGSLDLSGGMHDAGDHVKFGMPQSYAASTLGWGYYHFKDAFQSASQDQHMLEELKWFTDYFLRATFRNASGNVVAFAYQVGEGSVDHTLWAPPELHNLPRPAYLATSATPASDQAAGAAAALAIMYLNYNTVDPVYAAKCLDTARALYTFAKQNRGLGYSGGFYGSSYDEDELSWAAVWLYRATNDQAYITDITAVDGTGHYTGWLKKIIASTSDNWQNIWVHSWDTVWGGVFLELAPITNDPKHWYYARWNLEYWSGIPHVDPSDTTFLAGTPAGFKVINTWGSARYNAAAQLQAMVYRKYTGRTDFTDWARGQMNYIMGNNPMGYSYIVGYPSPTQSAQHPHHRAAHGSTTNSMSDPPNHRHVLWGALVGGPDTTDLHVDSTSDFVYNEVAIDYNAGLVGALAGLYKYYGAGQQPLANFPPLEPPETAYTDQGKIEQENNQRSQISLRLSAVPTHPPHYVTGLKARYFFNISELVPFGQNISAVSAQIVYDEQASSYGGSTLIAGPIAWDAPNGIYYVELDWSANAIYGKRDVQFALIAAQASDFASHWDPSNDWSHQGLTTTGFTASQYMPIYLNGVRVYGQEPGGSVTATPTNTPLPSNTPTRTNTPCGTCPTNTPTNTPLPTNTPTNTLVATNTPTNTPIPPSPTPCATCNLRVQHKQASASTTDGEIKPHLRIHNNGSTSVVLSTLKLRYWYTRDTAQPQTMNCDYAFVGCGNVTFSLVQMGTPVTGADFYLEVGFTAGAGSVVAGGNSGEIQSRFNKNDWSAYNELDDWSYAANAAFAENSKVTLYQSGALVWGSEPGGGPTNTPVPTNTPTNTPVATNTPTNTPVVTSTPTNTTCVCPTNTPTNTPMVTNTPTNTPVATNTPTNTPVATNTPTNTPLPTNTPTNTPIATNTPTNTPVPGGNLCATPTVITGGGSYSVPASGVCFKYVNAAFVRGAMWSIMNGSDTTVSNVVKWYGGRNETVTACINDTQTLNGNGAQLNNFTVAKDSASAMYVTITTNKVNTISMSIQNWQNGSGCSVAPTPQP